MVKKKKTFNITWCAAREIVPVQKKKHSHCVSICTCVLVKASALSATKKRRSIQLGAQLEKSCLSTKKKAFALRQYLYLCTRKSKCIISQKKRKKTFNTTWCAASFISTNKSRPQNAPSITSTQVQILTQLRKLLLPNASSITSTQVQILTQLGESLLPNASQLY